MENDVLLLIMLLLYSASIMTSEELNNIRNVAENITQRVHLNSLTLRDLQTKANNLSTYTQSLKENATKLQEGNIEGNVM